MGVDAKGVAQEETAPNIYSQGSQDEQTMISALLIEAKAVEGKMKRLVLGLESIEEEASVGPDDANDCFAAADIIRRLRDALTEREAQG